MRTFFSTLIMVFALACSSSVPKLIGPGSSTTVLPNPSFQSIALISRNAEEIKGYLFRPQGNGPFPAIIALHGCSGLFLKSGEMNSRDLEWGKRLSENGYVVLFPDSFNSRGYDEICTRPEKGDLPKTIRPYDAFAALKWLQSQTFVKKDKVALMGWSNGGSTLLWAVDRNSNARPVDLRFDFKIAIAFYPGCYHADLVENWANKIPTEILIGALDNWTEPKYCLSLVRRSDQNPPLKIKVYPDAYHDFDRPNSPVHEYGGLSGIPSHRNSATVGTNEVARAQAIAKAMALLKMAL
jgi:dienelactone hydrolase